MYNMFLNVFVNWMRFNQQVDFANRHLGGGVLGNGSVQEEIRFSICPELISSMLFMECMDENEAIIIQGFEQFSKCRGYAKTLEYDGNYVDKAAASLDHGNNISTTLVAIDALPYRFMRGKDPTLKQYLPEFYLKETNKAYVGFLQPYADNRKEGYSPHYTDPSWLDDLDPSCRRPIATGNWGCGAFGGDPQFKAMLQWIAASYAGCPAITFYTFNDRDMAPLTCVVEKMVQEKWTVGRLFSSIYTYAEMRYAAGNKCKGIQTYFETVLSDSDAAVSQSAAEVGANSLQFV